ncbi:uncharacterized protein LOC127836411 isoform X1 [Dreissena polymorpha]|nr:uncharacterized protein LOC127836411 isoform X1 [Dreissena polymorpha]
MKGIINRAIIISFCAVSLFSGYMAQKKKQCAKCYDCDMKIGKFDMVDCDGSCYTLEGRSEEGEQYIKRGCLSMKLDDNTCNSGRFDSYFGNVCACNGDMCNPANVHRPGIIGMIVASLLTVVVGSLGLTRMF